MAMDSILATIVDGGRAIVVIYSTNQLTCPMAAPQACSKNGVQALDTRKDAFSNMFF